MGNAYVEIYGITLVYGTAGGTPATPLGEIRGLRELPGDKVDKFDITGISQSTRDKDFVGSMIDNGMLKLTIGLDKTLYSTIRALRGVRKSWKLTYAQASTDAFDGFIELLQLRPTTQQQSGEILVDIDIQVCGTRTFTV